jgi:hypothetical protein
MEKKYLQRKRAKLQRAYQRKERGVAPLDKNK